LAYLVFLTCTIEENWMSERRTLQVLAVAGSLIFATLLMAETPQPSAAEEPGEEVCVIETSHGTMVFRLFEDQASATVANFKALVKEGFYDSREFYRVVAGHVIQTGDGGENRRPTVEAEFSAHPHVVGALGLARDQDPDSGNTEIYICLASRPHLDGRYAVFGLIIEGMEVLEKIGAVEVEEKWSGTVAFHEPKEPVELQRAFLERRVVDR
jgi:cyclophilin family peptidyl-prolyl cis-trans isomerase